MKRIFLFLLKPLSFLPALLIMYLIFSFSAQPGEISADLSSRVSHKLVSVGNDLLDLEMDEPTVSYYAEKIHPKVRKLAHMTEYFVLAVAVSFPLYVYGLRGFLLLLFAGAICVGFAGLDEYHQSFVAGRGPSLRDVGIDSIGIFAGILAVRIFCWSVLRIASPGKSRRKR